MTAPLRIDGETKVFPIIGHPIGQVKSPASLSQIMADRGFNGIVVPAHILPEDLSAWLDQAGALRNCDGIIVTVPHKGPCFSHCTRVTARARAAGAVNIMIRDRDGWLGDATDGQGFMDGVAAEGFDVSGKPALLVGAGGAGSAIAYEILARGATELAIHDIDAVRRDTLIERLKVFFPGRVRAGSPDPRGFALVANATPLGMREGDPFPVDVDLLVPEQFVGDVVTKPAITPLIAAARKIGCATIPGSGMFSAQAVLLAELLMGVRKLEIAD